VTVAEFETQRIPMVDLRRVQPVEQQVHLAEQVGQRLRLAAVEADGRAGFHVLEALHVALADVALVGGDAADVVRMVADEVGIQVVEGGAHFRGVFLIDAEDDGFREAVGLVHEVGEVAGDDLGAGAQQDDAFEIGGVVFVVRDRAAVAVEFVPGRPPARGVPLGDDAVDAVGRKEAIGDALAEGVGINGIAEVEVGVAVFLAQWGGRHAELIGGLEPIEDLAP
jgi:hypothetical protein